MSRTTTPNPRQIPGTLKPSDYNKYSMENDLNEGKGVTIKMGPLDQKGNI